MLIVALMLVPQLILAQKINPANGYGEREYLVKTLSKIAEPVLSALSKNELRKTMPVEALVAKEQPEEDARPD